MSIFSLNYVVKQNVIIIQIISRAERSRYVRGRPLRCGFSSLFGCSAFR